MATANGSNAQLMKRLEIKEKYENGIALGKNEFSAVVKGFKTQIEEALPTQLKKNAEKYLRQAIQLFSRNDTLQRCSAISVISALMTASGLGLDLTPELGQCYIIPYQSSRKTASGDWAKTWEAQFQLGYRGAIALAQRSGAVARIHADVACEKDAFRYSKGLSPTLEHEESQEEDRGAITHVYAVANFTNGGYAFEVWPYAKVVAHAKKFSQGYYKDEYKNNKRTGAKIENPNSPWAKDFESMAKKTLIKAIWKYLPVSTEVMLAGASDMAIRTDISGVQDEKDVLRLPVQSYGKAEDQGDEPDAGQDAAEPDAAEREPGSPPAPFDGALSCLLDLLGDGGLGLNAKEQAEYVTSRAGKQTGELTPDETQRLIGEVMAELGARDGA